MSAPPSRAAASASGLCAERSPGLLLWAWTLCRPRAPQPRLGGGVGGRGEPGLRSHGRCVRPLPARSVAGCSCGVTQECPLGARRLSGSAGRTVAACARPPVRGGGQWSPVTEAALGPLGFSVAVSATGQASVWGARTSGSVELSFTQPAGRSAPPLPRGPVAAAPGRAHAGRRRPPSAASGPPRDRQGARVTLPASLSLVSGLAGAVRDAPLPAGDAGEPARVYGRACPRLVSGVPAGGRGAPSPALPAAGWARGAWRPRL